MDREEGYNVDLYEHGIDLMQMKVVFFLVYQ